MPRSGDVRICVLHGNLPGILNRLTGVLSDAGLNIENMTNKSRGAAAYTMFDITGTVPATVADDLAALTDVVRVRMI